MAAKFYEPEGLQLVSFSTGLSFSLSLCVCVCVCEMEQF